MENYEVEPKKNIEDIYSIDWCDDTITRTLPWDDSQYITVRRLSDKEKRHRSTLAAKYRMGKAEDVEVQVAIGAIKEYEYTTCITDYRLLGKDDKTYLFSSPVMNRKVYDHFRGRLAKFVDDLITEINKDFGDDPEVGDIEGNSEGSSETA